MSDTSYYLKRLEQYMRSCPTCWPTFGKEQHFMSRVEIWHMIHRYNSILESYAVGFTSELLNRRFRVGYPEWDFVTAWKNGIPCVDGRNYFIRRISVAILSSPSKGVFQFPLLFIVMVISRFFESGPQKLPVNP